MRRIVLPLLALLALVGAALGTSACGSSSGDDAQGILKDTFGGEHNVKSGKVDLALGIRAAGGASQAPVSLRLLGPFESLGTGKVPKFDLNAAIGSGRQQQTIGAVSTGTSLFFKLDGKAYAAPPALYAQFRQGFVQAQQKSKQAKSGTLGALGIDPMKWLKDPQVRDDEQVAGVETKHVSAGVDVGRFADDLNKLLGRVSLNGSQAAPSFTPQQRKQFVDSIVNPRVDVWSGKEDKTLRKLTVTLNFKPSGTGASASSGGTLTFTLLLTNLNRPQAIAPPANPRSFSELTRQLKGLDLSSLGLGGGSSASSTGSAGSAGATGGGASAPSTGGTGSAGGTATQAYQDCIARASGDVAEAQKCAGLLP
jgi:hypothetical protein